VRYLSRGERGGEREREREKRGREKGTRKVFRLIMLRSVDGRLFDGETALWRDFKRAGGRKTGGNLKRRKRKSEREREEEGRGTGAEIDI